MPKYKLSICIPTYNRGKFIGETMQSIIDSAQGIEGIEIAISDNASTDNTKEIVESFRQHFPNITYFCWDENMGADRNYLKAVEIASSEYCWLMGSDDKIKQGSIQYLLNSFEKFQTASAFLFGRVNMDYNLQSKIFDEQWITTNQEYSEFNFNEIDSFTNYCQKANSLGALFSYLSSIIVKKDNWSKIIYNDVCTGSLYSHVFIIMNMLLLNEKNTLVYINNQQVLNRTDNDTFLDKGYLNRALIDFRGYFLLSEIIFLNKEEYKVHFFNVLKSEYSLQKIIYVLENSNNKKIQKEQINEFFNSLITVGFGVFYIKLIKNLYFLNFFSISKRARTNFRTLINFMMAKK